MRTELPKHNLVLLGAGHTNAHIIRMWRMERPLDAQLICVSNFAKASYSGMLPGVLAGQYPPERMEIDLVRLCAANDVRLIVDELTGVDVAARELQFQQRPPLRFDALSVGVGSSPDMTGVPPEADNVLPIKPMQSFIPRVESAVRRARPGDRPLSVAVVGAGLGGVEIALCMPRRLSTLLDGKPSTTTLVTSGSLGSGLTDRSTKLVRRQCDSLGVRLELGRRVERVENGQLVYDNGERGTFDLILWATSAQPPPVLELFDLPKDERGFLLVDGALKTTHDDTPIFAVGDSGTMVGESLPKAGVYAVRQGPILWENLQRAIRGESLERYKPQRRFLKLVNLGDGRAVAEYGPLSVCSKSMWRLKDWIDGRFMDKYQDYREPMMMSETPDAAAKVMRCAGCGGKVGASVLSRALARLSLEDPEHVQVGLDDPDDVALLDLKGNGLTAATVDFFSAPFDDPYLVGRLAALNSASDMFASGVAPQAALTVATLPIGHPRAQEQVMLELMAGGLEELKRMGATLIGGHTIEGPQMSIGYAMLGRSDTATKPLLKSGVRPNDVFILTKPIGVGVLLAAHMRAMCRATWWTPLLETMLVSNQVAAAECHRLGVSALTDVTGFGLAGHMLEMLQASSVSARLWLSELPVLDGAVELVEQGVESTLAPANRNAEMRVRAAEPVRRLPKYALLFDPQTSGGLLAAAAPETAQQVIEALGQMGVAGVIIGRAESTESQAELVVTASAD